MQIKIIMRCLLTLVRISKLKNKCWGECGEKGILLNYWWEYKLYSLCIWSSNSTTGYLPKNTKTLIQKDICTSMFITILNTRTKVWKELKCSSIDEWVTKMWCVYTHTHTHTHYGILLNYKKEWNLTICNNIGYYAKTVLC